MKAICIHQFGGPEVLKYEDVPDPMPGAGEVLVKIRAASVNPVDYKTREGSYPAVKQSDLPTVLGRDVAGMVEKTGANTDGFKPGDEVYAMLDSSHGGYAEFTIVTANTLAKKPRTLNMTEAAAVPLAAITAWQGLFDQGGLKSGQKVLIHGGSGGVGGFAVQFAKVKGAEVYTTVGANAMQMMRDYGATPIDYKSQKFQDIVPEVDLVYDLIGGETQDRSWKVLKQGGTMISTLSEPDAAKAREKQAKAARYMAKPDAAQLSEIGKLIDDGKVRVVVVKTFLLAAAADAQRAAENEHPKGKIVLQTG
jgi:NADPH:quinone reductase-like Zn-dependent oxidoreductase